VNSQSSFLARICIARQVLLVISAISLAVITLPLPYVCAASGGGWVGPKRLLQLLHLLDGIVDLAERQLPHLVPGDDPRPLHLGHRRKRLQGAGDAVDGVDQGHGGWVFGGLAKMVVQHVNGQGLAAVVFRPAVKVVDLAFLIATAISMQYSS
jgi:hypothetical protein